MTRALVTGGAGFIGSNLVRHLLRHRLRWSVAVLDKPTYAGRRAPSARAQRPEAGVSRSRSRTRG